MLGINHGFYLTCAPLLLGIGCGYIEGDYEIVTEDDLIEAGIHMPFPEWGALTDEEGRRITRQEILRQEGYSFQGAYGYTHKVVKGDNEFRASTRVIRIHLFNNYVVLEDGNTGVEDGFIRYFLRPVYSRLNVFERETFDLIDQRIVHGVVRNVVIIGDSVYFHVADYEDKGFYGRYRLEDPGAH